MPIKAKANVDKFSSDIDSTGSYIYTKDKLSSKYANARITQEFKNFINFNNQTILDIGCGDGAYSFELLKNNPKFIHGIDPSNKAIQSAKNKRKKLSKNNQSRISFSNKNLYDLQPSDFTHKFDLAVLRGVLHHLPDQKEAFKSISRVSNSLLIMEPNGLNPILKIIEKTSTYHIEHEEQSFTLRRIERWLNENGFNIKKYSYVNIIPFFCPDWFAKILRFVMPLFESIPLIKKLYCGQLIILAERS